jgi:hypothetical protein
MRQATYRELMNAIEAVMRQGEYGAHPSDSKPRHTPTGVVTEHVFIDRWDYLHTWCVCAMGGDAADAFVIRSLSTGTLREAEVWDDLQAKLREVGATAEMLPHTLTQAQVEALLRAVLSAEDVCKEMVERANRLSDVAHSIGRVGLEVRLDALADVGYDTVTASQRESGMPF